MTMKDENPRETDSVFHERINILKDQGYRGYTVTGGRETPGGVEVQATNSRGQILTSSGESKDEAFENMIDLIDQTLDE